MSLEEEFGNEDELKKEFRKLDENLRQDPVPLEALARIETWVEEITWNPETPSKFTEFFLRHMIPKFVATLMRRRFCFCFSLLSTVIIDCIVRSHHDHLHLPKHQ